MLAGVLTDLAAIFKKLADNSEVPEYFRVKAREFVEEFDWPSPYRGKATAAQYSEAEKLLQKMA